MEQTIEQENEEIARIAKRKDKRNALIALALTYGMGCFMLGSDLGEKQGYSKGKEAAQINTLVVGNLTGNNPLSNDVMYVQADGEWGVFKYAPRKDYFSNFGYGAIIESSEPSWQRTNIESNLVKKAFEEITRKTYSTPYAGLGNSQKEYKINHYTGKPSR